MTNLEQNALFTLDMLCLLLLDDIENRQNFNRIELRLLYAFGDADASECASSWGGRTR